MESEKRGITFEKLLTVPEKDNWAYKDGQSASCVAFVLMMYKEAGLFDPISSSIEVTEFTVSTPESLCLNVLLYKEIDVRTRGSGGHVLQIQLSGFSLSSAWSISLCF